MLRGNVPIERDSLQETAALYVLQKQKFIDILKVLVSVHSSGNGDKKELRKYFTMFLDEVSPELKEEREKNEARLSKVIEEEGEKVYHIKPTHELPRFSRKVGSKLWRRR